MTYVAISFGNTFGNGFLMSQFTGKPWWLGLHGSDPGPLSDPATEVAGGGYERQPITFGNPTGKIVLSVGGQTFDGMPAGFIYFLAIWSAFSGGFTATSWPVPGSPLAPNSSNQVLVGPGDVAIALP